MKIIIPMSGLGKRFQAAGYTKPKPLIIVDGKPIIEHVIDIFGREHEYIFICNENHLASTPMRQIIESIIPAGRILSIKQHDLGPVYATKFAFPYIRDDEDIIISYCDYNMVFDLDTMLERVKQQGYRGAVPSYTGFHPHLLHKKLYGGVLVDEDGRMRKYQEKHSFTEDPTESHHSAGMYYFSSGKEFKEYTDELLASDIHINGEKYTSMLYYLYLRDNKPVYVPEVPYFMQWGTPEDLEEYEAWSREIAQQLSLQKKDTEIPAAREPYTALPYKEGTVQHEACSRYWKNYFSVVE